MQPLVTSNKLMRENDNKKKTRSRSVYYVSVAKPTAQLCCMLPTIGSRLLDVQSFSNRRVITRPD